MIDTVFGIKVRMSGLCINRYRPLIGRLLDADRPLPYRCISSFVSMHFDLLAKSLQHLCFINFSNILSSICCIASIFCNKSTFISRCRWCYMFGM